MNRRIRLVLEERSDLGMEEKGRLFKVVEVTNTLDWRVFEEVTFKQVENILANRGEVEVRFVRMKV